MRDLLGWNVHLFRIAGVGVRLHAGLAATLFAAVAGSPTLAAGAILAGALLLAVTLIEAARVAACLRLGGRCDEVILGPAGGLAPHPPLEEPQDEWLVWLAGPGALLVACVGWMAWFGSVSTTADLAGELNPLMAPGVEAVEGRAVAPWSSAALAATLLWTHWVVLLVSLVPAPPSAAGRVAASAIALRWPPAQAARMVGRLSQALGGLAGIAAMAVLATTGAGTASMVLFLAGLAWFFWGREEASAASRSMTPFPELQPAGVAVEREPGVLHQWLRQWKAVRQERAQRQQAEDDRRMDEVLSRIHDAGINSLSSEERAILDRVSARYRSRPRG
jgi:hypothetical protein